MVIRPDSGDPKEMVLEVMQKVYKAFGGYKNSKGYIVLDDCVRIIQGDGVDSKGIKIYFKHLKSKVFQVKISALVWVGLCCNK